MTTPKQTRNMYLQSLTRLGSGIILAFALYHLALKFATTDCYSLQGNLRDGGPWMMARILGLATLAALIGIPASIIALSAGIATGPIIGAPLTSVAVVVSSGLHWIAGRFIYSQKRLPESLDRLLENSVWYRHMMDDRSTSGLHWTATHGLTSPIPYPFIGFLTGARVRHLSPQSLLAGIFLSSLLHVAGYSLAGASIGCSVINYALGYDITQYRPLMLVSCLILILLSRLQTSLTGPRSP